MLNTTDEEQINALGISLDTVYNQIEQFKKGFPPMTLERAAIPQDGIIVLNKKEEENFISFYSDHSTNYNIVKFVPASGAASRMFKSVFSFMENNLGKSNQDVALMKEKKMETFFSGLTEFAFYDDLKEVMIRQGLQLEPLIEDGKYAEVLEFLLTEKGLNYGNLPKGLLKFHKEEGRAKMPVEEHLLEGAEYAKDSEGKVNLHFTVSPEHEPEFKKKLAELLPEYEQKLGVRFVITYSQQLKSTDTIAVDESNQPFRNPDGSLLFRPAGHGALLRNLNSLESDIVFLQNIDNVVPDKLKPKTTSSKKVLGGVLLSVKEKVQELFDKINRGEVENSELRDFLAKELNTEMPSGATREEMIAKLDRPLRVCGMVLNTGEAGGGPFWCKNQDNSVSLQIVESSQFDTTNESQMKIVKSSTHFNPVDVVVFKKDLQGQKYNSLKHVDEQSAFISSKSKDGKALKAMELPGLWNGSMSDWNTIFVEVPAITFNPVKEVNDLLRDEHRSS